VHKEDRQKITTQKDHPMHHSHCHTVFCKLCQNSQIPIKIWN